MSQLVAYLSFDGNCREAFEFYQHCLGGNYEFQKVGESPMAKDMPASLHDQVLHGSLTNGSIKLMGADTLGMSGSLNRGNAVALCLVCSSKEDIERFFSRLSEDGQVTNPLREEFFGTYADLTDRYGIRWMLQYDGANMGAAAPANGAVSST